ncbi:MAG: hypothetical protein FWC78_03185 [Defluviitaleaceae bacterium]|nr:hypothetical protein [Defluviitaleaceae bacterium]
MDCKQSELAMMQHFDKIIHPKTARKLAKHILTCQSCRELFLLMDESAEIELVEAPAGFTQTVMAKVNTAGAYSPQDRLAFPGMLWGLVAIIAGALLIAVANTDLINTITNGYPLMEMIMYVFGDAVVAVRMTAERFMHGIRELNLDGWLSISALALSMMMIGLLAVLYKDDATAIEQTT